ncbi:MAG: ABC transporter permease [Eubacteriales bacterium]
MWKPTIENRKKNKREDNQEDQKERKSIPISKGYGITLVISLSFLVASFILVHHNPLADPLEEWTKKIIACCILVGGVILLIVKYDAVTILPVELYQNRHLIWKLSKNDFKTRYAGSYLGMIWAFIQPIVMVFMYWFVFEIFMGQDKAEILGTGLEVPYVIYLISGLVPWFYFSEALTNATSALLEYNYLVKKVVFKISILPIIKIIAATFVHLFFLVFMVLFACIGYGMVIDWYMLQLFYYSICLFIFVLGVSYATCSIVIFFRDLSQIIQILLQLGMWGTPILWQLATLPEEYHILFKLNPVYYIVNGYRISLFEEKWFFEDFYSTTYFWIITVILFGLGATLFKRLKVHFADVL